ncbi:MAG: segregation/condensation protein A [Oscillospiraceae bacterium]|nr:segregation/condensation protein A [Oscillospiraceae bacterium]
MGAPTYRLPQVVRADRNDKSERDGKEDFEGPLDLILHLISKRKIEIRDIKISELLTQYLHWLEQMKRMDLDVASEFIAMASHLVYIKSRMLLSLSDDGPEQELDLLMQALEERKRQEIFQHIKEGRDFLTARADVGGRLFARPQERIAVDKTYAFHHAPGELEQVLRGMYERLGRRALPTPAAFGRIVGREPYAVDDMIALLVRRLSLGGEALLSRLLSLGANRAEWVVLFLAILELCRNHRLRVEAAGVDYLIGLDSGEDGNQGD